MTKDEMTEKLMRLGLESSLAEYAQELNDLREYVSSHDAWHTENWERLVNIRDRLEEVGADQKIEKLEAEVHKLRVRHGDLSENLVALKIDQQADRERVTTFSDDYQVDQKRMCESVQSSHDRLQMHDERMTKLEERMDQNRVRVKSTQEVALDRIRQAWQKFTVAAIKEACPYCDGGLIHEEGCPWPELMKVMDEELS